jgi:hypothetical protein
MSDTPKDPETPDDKNTLAAIIAAIESTETEPSRHLSIQIDDSLRDAIRAAQSSGQPADVTLKIKVKPGPDRRVSFTAGLSAKIPRPPVSAVTLYADEEGNVHRSDPAQLRMPFTGPTPITSKRTKDN